MNSILITGCNRGIGLGLVKALLKLPKPPKHLFATCRDICKAEELRKISEENCNVHVLEIDLKNFNKYDKLTSSISELVRDEGLNVLFNCAGVAPKSTRINFVKVEDFTETLLVNTVAPVMLTKACLPLLKKASCAHESYPMGVRRAAVINMSSVLGSIEKNIDGGLFPYRASKAALNMATRSLSIDLMDSKILCVSIHPGWVRTDMGGPKAPMDVESSCKNIVNTIIKLDELQNGQFFQYDGERLPW